jgi:hypothetical protein
MKYSMFFLLTCLCTFSFAQKQSKINSSEVASVKKSRKKDTGDEQLYLLCTGSKTQEITKAEFEKIEKDQIEYVRVLKDAAITDMYGDKGKNGVVLVVLKSNSGNKKPKQRQG